MDAVSYAHSAKQAQKIERFIEDPDSTSGIVTVPKVIASGETITIPAGRVAILPNVQINGVLNVEGEVFIPSGATLGDLDAQLALKAPLVNPAFTNPTATTQAAQDNSTKVATTAYVDGKMVLGTAVNSTSGTAIDFTGIPSWTKKVTLTLAGVSTNGSSGILIRIGDSGGISSSGYVGGATRIGAASEVVSSGFAFADPSGMNISTALWSVVGTVALQGNSKYVWSCNGVRVDAITLTEGVGYKTMSDAINTIRVTTVNGTDTFDAGQINIMYEG